MKPKKARIKDIAQLAGVSIGTVDRVLHNRGEVSETTSRKIRNIIKETHYSPNFAARILKWGKSQHIVSLLPHPDEINSYWKKHPAGMLRAVTEFEPFRLNLTRVTFDMQSEADFHRKIDTVLSLDPDGVLMAPIFKSQSLEFCRKLTEKNIPFVFIDTYIDDTGFITYIGEDVYQSGKVAGQLTDLVTAADDDILIVNIAKNLSNVHHLANRTQGFLNYFEASGRNRGTKITISIHEPTARAVNAGMNRAFARNPRLGSIFITGSKSYLIASWLEEKCLGRINLVGYDLLESNVGFLKSGMARFLISQRPEEQAYLGIRRLFEYLAQIKVPGKFEYLPVDIATSENVDYFLRQPISHN